MITISQYRNMSAAEKKEYLDSLSPAERNNFIDRLSSGATPNTMASGFGETHAQPKRPQPAAATTAIGTAWAKGQMSWMTVAILIFPLSGFLFFVASQFHPETKEQGFSLLRNTVIYLIILALFFPVVMAIA